MALLRRLFYRKPPDGLLEICERVYVFDYCFSTDAWEEAYYKGYIEGAINQLREHNPDASILVFNFKEGESKSQIANALSEHDMTIMDYPRHYEGCPLLSMEVIHHFLRSSESWLSLGQQNVLLMHCERGGWPILAFMLAALLIYRRHYSGEQKTLDMVYKQAPRELLHFLSPLNPIPSQLRYLQYVSRRSLMSEWPPLDRALSLDCIIMRMIPKFDEEGGFRPIFRIYGQDPSHDADRTPKILFSTPKKSKAVRHYKQVECELVKIDINCHIQGDVVLECINLYDDMEREQMIFRAMFNTAFIRSNILMLNRDEIDILWGAKDQFPKDFRAEVLFSEMDADTPIVPSDLSFFEEKDGLPVEAFAKVHEIFSNVDWLVPNADALNVIHHAIASDVVHEKLTADVHQCMETSPTMREAIVVKLLEKEKYAALGRDDKSSVFSKDQSGSSPTSFLDANLHKQATESQHMDTKSLLNRKQIPSPSPASEPFSPVSSENSDAGQASPPFPSHHHLKKGPMHPSAEDISGKGMVVPSDSASETSHLKSTPISPIASPMSPNDPLIGFLESESVSPMPASPSKVASRSSPPPSSIPPGLPTAEIVYSSHGMFTTGGPVSVQSSLSMQPSPPPAEKKDHAKQIGSPPPTSLTVDTDYKMTPPLLLEPAPPLVTNATLPPKDVLNHENKLPRTAMLVMENTDMIGGPSIPASLPTQPLEDTSSSGTPPPPLPFKEFSASGNGPPPPPALPPPKEVPAARGGPSPPSPPPPPPLYPSKDIAASRGGPPPPLPPKEYSAPGGAPCPTPTPPLPPSKIPASRGGPLPPPPPPPPPPHPSGPAMVPINSPAVPPPPLHSGPAAAFKSPVAPPPPPPPVGSAAVKPVVPSAPPPPPPCKRNSMVGVEQTHPLGSSSPQPPSAPPPGGKGRNLSRTTTSKSNQTKKLKPLHWLKLSRAAQGSLWAETQKSSEALETPEIDISELESLFSAAVPSSDQSGSKGSSRASLGQKPEKVQLVEHRRAYNCEIMLSNVKIPLPDLLSSVLILEDSAMDVDQVENLIKFCPTKEEMELLKGYKGEKDKLGKCEQFFLELMQVPRIESKLRVFSFKIQFQSQVSELRNNLNIINSAADQIRNSTKLKRIMQTILSLGNALNQGTARGSAVGFRLDSLLKLAETRARNNKLTLMHYLCKVLEDKLPEVLNFSQDLSSLENAAKIQLKFLAEEMQAISKGLEKVVQELSMSENDGPVSENFYKVLKEFLSFAEGEVRSLASLYSGVGRNVDALILYFGEDPSRCPYEQVTSTLLNFVRMFKKAREENDKQLELEKKKAEKEAAAENAEKIKTSVSKGDIGKMHALKEMGEKQKMRALEGKAEKPKINASDRIMSI